MLKSLLVEVVPRNAKSRLCSHHRGAAACLSTRRSNKPETNSGREFAGGYEQRQTGPPKSAHPTTHPEFVPMEFSSTNLV